MQPSEDRALAGEAPRGQSRILVNPVVFVLSLSAVATSSLYSYTLFHSLAELFSVTVGLLTGVVAWYTYPLSRNHFVTFLGISFGCIAGIDLFHTLAYKGMGVFVGFDANLPTQLWIGSRYVQAAVLLTAPVFIHRRLNPLWALVGVASVAALITALPFLGRFPDAWVEGRGLTPFKIYSEYLLVGALLIAASLVWSKRTALQPHTLHMILAAIGFSAASQLAFTSYVSVYGTANLVGHLLKIVAFWLIFHGLIRTTLQAPFSALTREATTYNAIPVPVTLVDPRGRIRQANEATFRLFERDAESLLGRQVHDLFHSPSVPRAHCPVCRRLASGEATSEFELALGAGRWASVYLAPVRHHDASAGVVHVYRDITERKGVELATGRIYRALQTISSGDQALVHATDEDDLLRRMCRVAVERGGYRLAGVVLPSVEHGIRTASSFGDGAELLEQAPFRESPLIGDLVRAERPLVLSNLASPSPPLPWAADALARGLGAVVGLPLRVKDNPVTLGALILFASEPQPVVAEELHILEKLAGDLAFGLDALRTRGAHEKAVSELKKINRALRTISACNQAMIHASDEAALLDEICRIIVEQGGYRMAWVGFCEDDPEKLIRPVSHAGLENGYLEEVDFSWDDARWTQTVAGTAIRTGKPSIVNEVATADHLGSRREVALERGFAAVMAFPLAEAGGRVLGALAIYHHLPQVFTEEEVAILQQLASDLAYGVLARRTQLARDEAEARELEQLDRLSRAMEGTVEAMATLAEQRDRYTAGHQRRVAALAESLASRMGLDPERVRGIRMGAVIHDIGKVSVPSEILNRPGRLSPLELEIIKGHAQVGYDVVKGVEFAFPIAEMIYQHHERLDGSGYPLGLAGDQIILEARILAVADVVEAMSSHRPYRPGHGIATALEDIEAGAGVIYDATVVEHCLRLFREEHFEFTSDGIARARTGPGSARLG